MSFRLEQILDTLISKRDYTTIDNILYAIDIEHTGNCLNDLVDIAVKCKPFNRRLDSFYYFKERLINKIVEQRGEEGQTLIEKVK